MFRLAKPSQTYVHTVAVTVPGAQDSEQTRTFDARFWVLSTSKFRALFKPENLAEVSDYQVIREFLAGWEPGAIQRHDGTDLTFGEEALRQLCDINYWAQAVVEAYIDFHSGARTKNFKAPPATG